MPENRPCKKQKAQVNSDVITHSASDSTTLSLSWNKQHTGLLWERTNPKMFKEMYGLLKTKQKVRREQCLSIYSNQMNTLLSLGK